MIRFLIKGLLRDRSRSVFPFLTVLSGVTLSVVLYSWVRGTETDLVRANASFSTGHLRVTTRGYLTMAEQAANQFVLTGVAALRDQLGARHPGIRWAPRIRFAGLLDVPDEHRETRAQAPVTGLAIDLLTPTSVEHDVLNLRRALKSGRLPARRGEALLSDDLARRLRVRPGDTVTLISTTRFGGMTTANLTMSGTIRFGISAVDRGAVLADVEDVREALDMPDAAGELLGFMAGGRYRDAEATLVADGFNRRVQDEGDLRPVMGTLRADAGVATVLDLAGAVTTALIVIFVAVMSIVLWNAGLMAALRRYGEIGVRLAIGESHGHLYRSLLAESALVGLAGSVLGTVLGVAVSYYLQLRGVNIAPFLRNASLLISDVLRAEVTVGSYLIGFVPGLLATLAGTAISGIGIYRRQTSSLAKEFES